MRVLNAALVAAAAPVMAALAQPAPHDHAAAGAENAPASPGLGEMMALQQMRHLKLWFAGRARNWPLADYQVDELKEGFEDVTKLLGGDTVEKAVGEQIAAVEKAIDAKDRRAFTAAFDKLTAGCNGCHKSLNHGYIVIQRPAAMPYSNQSFAPARR
jgi:hypothetical protein